MLWQLIYNLANHNFLICTILFVIASVISVKSIVARLGFTCSIPAALAGMTMPMSLTLCENISAFTNARDSVITAGFLLELILLILSIRNGFSAIRAEKNHKSVFLMLQLVFSYYTFGTVAGSTVLYFSRERGTFLKVLVFLGVSLGVFLFCSGAGSIPKPIDDNDNGVPTAIGGYNGTWRSISENWDVKIVESDYGDRFTYDKNTGIWSDSNGNSVDPGKYGLDDASKFY